MNRTFLRPALLLAALPLLAPTLTSAAADAGQAPGHVMMEAAQLQWGPAPPGLPPGSKLAVIKGDPSQDGPFVIRVWVPAGYRVAPHWHPTTESLTILSGTVGLGMGDTFDPTKGMTLGPGGFAAMPALGHHFFWAQTEATFQVHANGPFAIFYLNPADDPRGMPAR